MLPAGAVAHLACRLPQCPLTPQVRPSSLVGGAMVREPQQPAQVVAVGGEFLYLRPEVEFEWRHANGMSSSALMSRLAFFASARNSGSFIVSMKALRII